MAWTARTATAAGARRASRAVALAAALSGAALLSLTLSVAALTRTPHNLRNLTAAPAPTAAAASALPAPRGAAASADSRQLCVFCHTPEAVNADDLRTPPRWQRSVAGDHRYGAYVGELIAPGPDGLDALGHSMVCLSCHDAVQAPLATGRSDDHPIGVPYRGDPASLTQSGGAHATGESPTARELRRRDPVEYRPPSSAVMNERLVWWASSSRNPAQRTRADLPLYPRRQIVDDGTAAQDVPFIECGTCHDPHSGNTLFLRVPNTTGQLCMTCHNK